MAGHLILRTVALVVSATLLASLTVATVATPASAAKQKVTCRGHVATIVGTNKAERLVGTNRADVIAGLGGNDVIIGGGGNDLLCGGTGRDRLAGKGGRDRLYGNGGPDILIGGTGPDRLFGGVGNDRLTGQAGNDTLGGGPGTDTCYQGTGAGPAISCELPPPPPVVAPPPPPPLIPLDGIFAVAYTDMNGNHVYDVEDVLISKLVDTNGNGSPGPGDTVVMGSYPTNLAGSSFNAWGVLEHSVDSVYVGTFRVLAKLSNGAEFAWGDQRLVSPELPPAEWFSERHSIMTAPDSLFQDSHYPGSPGPEAPLDAIVVEADSPSQPQGPGLDFQTTRATDDGFVDVEIPYLGGSV